MTHRYSVPFHAEYRAIWLLAIAWALVAPALSFAQDEASEPAAAPAAAAPEASDSSDSSGATEPTEVKKASESGDQPTPSLPPIEVPDLTDLLPSDWPASEPTPPAPMPMAPSSPMVPGSALPPAPPETTGGRLPWEKAVETPDVPVLRPPDGPLELLERFDIGPSRMEGFFNGEAWSPAEEDTLIRILYRFPRLGLDNLMRWRLKDVNWDEVVAAPWNYRGKIFRLEGRVRRVVRERIDPETAERFEFPAYYRVSLDVNGSPFDAIVLSRRVPEAWKLDADIDEPAAVDAMFLKLGEEDESLKPPLIFAAGSMAWYPEKPDPALHLGPDQLKLIEHGLDWSHFNEALRKGNGRPFTDADREPFYELLDLVGRVDPNTLIAPKTPPLDVVPLLARPAERHGEIVRVKGTARRIIKVLVEDTDIRARYGIDHYYEIDMFLPLGKATVRMGKDATGEENPVYNNAFPATLIVRELPPGVTEGENLGLPLETAAVFFKVWSYRSNYTDKFKKLQPAPMFIAQRPESYDEIRPSNWLTDIFVGGAMGTAVLVLVLVFWWFQRSDRSHRATVRASDLRKAIDEANPDFSKIETSEPPNFNDLK